MEETIGVLRIIRRREEKERKEGERRKVAEKNQNKRGQKIRD